MQSCARAARQVAPEAGPVPSLAELGVLLQRLGPAIAVPLLPLACDRWVPLSATALAVPWWRGQRINLVYA